MLDALQDALLDTLKMAPILFLAYLLLEWLEHRGGEKINRILGRAKTCGPLFGAGLGLLPQCGFSGAVASFYASGTVTAGTLLAVLISTSDEMLPIFLSARVDWAVIGGLLLCKFAIGLFAGFCVDMLWHQHRTPLISKVAGCSCHGKGIFYCTLKRTGKILLLIFLVSFGLNLLFLRFPSQVISWVWQIPVVGSLVAVLLGLIPNCSVSVLLSELYVEGVLGFPPLLSGLVANGGVGLLVLFRSCARKRDAWKITGILAGVALVSGFTAELFF